MPHLLSGTINWPDVGWRALGILLTWLAVGFLVRHLGRWFDALFARVAGQGADRRELRNLDTLLDVLLIAAGAIITLAILELTPLLLSLLTAAGVTGVIVGFAVKDVAANLIAGIFLLIDRPFIVGDFVAAGNIQGTVEQISLRVTRIRTVDGPVVTVPSNVIAANAITNYSTNPLRRIELALTLPMDADADAATNLLLDLAAAEPRLTAEPAPEVLMADVRPQAFDLKLICWVRTGDWLQVQSDLKRALLLSAQTAGLPAALPAQVVYTSPIPKGDHHGGA